VPVSSTGFAACAAALRVRYLYLGIFQQPERYCA
jgi:hypothetical protein